MFVCCSNDSNNIEGFINVNCIREIVRSYEKIYITYEAVSVFNNEKFVDTYELFYNDIAQAKKNLEGFFQALKNGESVYYFENPLPYCSLL